MLLSAISDLSLQFFGAEELNGANVQSLGRVDEINGLLNWLVCLDHEPGDLGVEAFDYHSVAIIEETFKRLCRDIARLYEIALDG